MCAAFGKRPNDFLVLSSTKAFQSALSEELKALPENLVTVVRGGNLNATEQGTWLHLDLAMECARWLSPKFSLWCSRVIRRILEGKAPAFPIPRDYPEELEFAAARQELTKHSHAWAKARAVKRALAQVHIHRGMPGVHLLDAIGLQTDRTRKVKLPAFVFRRKVDPAMHPNHGLRQVDNLRRDSATRSAWGVSVIEIF